MTKYNLKNIIKKSIKPLITEQSNIDSHDGIIITVCDPNGHPNFPMGTTMTFNPVNSGKAYQCNNAMCATTGGPYGMGDIGGTFQLGTAAPIWKLIGLGNPIDSSTVNQIASLYSSGMNGNTFSCDNGCTDPTAINYDANAVADDGSCLYGATIPGCTDPTMSNYNAAATVDDGSCIPFEVHLELQGTICHCDASINPDCGVSLIVGTNINLTAVNTPGFTCNGVLCTTANLQDVWMDDPANAPGLVIPAGVTISNPAFVQPAMSSGTPFNIIVNPNGCAGNPIPGCTDLAACNYNPLADTDDGSCEVPGFCEECDLSAVQSPFVQVDASCYGCDDPNITGAVVGVGGGCATCNVYDPNVVYNDGSCCTLGCTDPNSQNYDLNACIDDGSCIPHIYGCQDINAQNYDPTATTGPVIAVNGCYGCIDPAASNECNDPTLATINTLNSCVAPSGAGTLGYDCSYNFIINPSATNFGDNSCCDYAPILGCTDPAADNYDATATQDDGSCVYIGCADLTAIDCLSGTIPMVWVNNNWCYAPDHQGCDSNQSGTPDPNDNSCCKYMADLDRDRDPNIRYNIGCADPTAIDCSSGLLPMSQVNQNLCYDPDHEGCDSDGDGIPDVNDTSCCKYQERDRGTDPPEPGPCDEFFNTTNPGQQRDLCRECFHALNNGVTWTNSGLSTDDNCSCCKSVDFIMPVKESLKEIFQRRAGIKNKIK